MPITLRPADKAHARYLLDLEETCMRGYAEALWGNWRPSDSAESLDVAGHELIVLDGEVVGCVAVTWHPDHLFIDKLYIAPPFQGRGIGAAVLRGKVDEAAGRMLATKLSVLATNPAIGFYRREGFVLETETAERRRMSKTAVPPPPLSAGH